MHRGGNATDSNGDRSEVRLSPSSFLHFSRPLTQKKEPEDRVLQEALLLHRQGSYLEGIGNQLEGWKDVQGITSASKYPPSITALHYYRRAARLVPDVEYQAYRLQQQRHEAETTGTTGSAPTPAAARDNKPAAASPADVDDLAEALAQLNPAVELDATTAANAGHFADLPREMLLRIFVECVLPLGDLQALGRLACVCRAFYLVAQDPHLWQFCARSLHRPSPRTPEPFNSWRALCLKRPRPLWHGVYVSKVSYVRPGEQSMDEHYRPFHVVTYFRYLRFFPNGTALTVMSSEEPQMVGRGRGVWLGWKNTNCLIFLLIF
jgi:hypothetical protein